MLFKFCFKWIYKRGLYMADNYVKLIDVDTGFIIVSSNMRVEIKYGQ